MKTFLMMALMMCLVAGGLAGEKKRAIPRDTVLVKFYISQNDSLVRYYNNLRSQYEKAFEFEQTRTQGKIEIIQQLLQKALADTVKADE